MTTDTDTLTLGDVVALAEIARAAQTCAPVRYINAAGDLIAGTARCIGDERGCFAGPHDDVRDMFLRITTAGGWEVFEPVRDLMPKLHSGEFCVA